ncbi:MAG: FtsX-like permease family protein, partial [Acutalibacteraceae bacterium]|nr:FtsX-like permease family protein [Acutalibacteraceae bacterium]
SLTEKKDHQTKAEQMVDYVLYNEFCSSSAYSYAGLIMVGSEKMEKLISERPPMSEITEGYINFYSPTDNYSVDSNYMATFDDIKGENIIWIDGEKKTLGEKEIIATLDVINPYNEELGSEAFAKSLKSKNTLSAWEYNFYNDENTEGWKLVGIIDNVTEGNKSKLNSTLVTSDSVFKKYTEGSDKIYSFAVGAMPEDKEEVRSAVAYCYREDSNIRYQVQNSVTFELDSVNDALKIMSKYFFWIGIGFAAFAALMLANFIGTSISYKKQEIGILRAIGSRSNDVFRIFFAESFIIAMINFVLSSIGVFVVTVIINQLMRTEVGILITILSFGIRQLVLLLAVSIFVAFIASFLPVKRIASKRPIDAIRNR